VSTQFSTTTIDGALGHAGVPKAIWDRAGARGRAVHAAIYYLEGGEPGRTLDWDSVHPEIRPYLTGYEKFKFEHDVRFELSERAVVSRKHRYGGTLDAVLLDGERVLADWKSGIQLGRHGAQLAAYKNALIEEGYPGAEKLRRKCVYLTAAGGYHVVEYSGEGDFYDFLALQRIYATKEHHSGKY